MPLPDSPSPVTATFTSSPIASDTAGRREPYRHEWSRTVRGIGYAAVILSLTVACVTFFVLMGLTPIEPTQEVVFWSMVINGLLVALLLFAISWEIVVLVMARRRGQAGARLHIRIVALFSIVAATPAILVAVVASITLDRGLDHWFSTRTQAIVNTSMSVAEAYVQEHGRSVGSDLLAMKGDFERARSLLEEDPDRFQTFINTVAQFRNLPGVYLIRRDGTPIVRANVGVRREFPPPPAEALADAETANGMPVLIAPGSTNLVGGLVRLSGYDNAYLYVIRQIDPKVTRYMQMITEGTNEYRNLEATRFGVQVAFAILYLGISLVVLLSAIWLGIGFANWLVSPIRRLINAADQVAHGDLDVHVDARRSDGDLGALGTTFNNMTAQLRSHHSEMMAANEQIDSRRRFTEAVLSGVTAGVVGVDQAGIITIANRMALRLLAISLDSAVGKSVTDVVPELAPVVSAARHDDRQEHRDQVTITRAGRERTINVRVTTESTTAGDHGYVITLDDITDLVVAQRNSAWADVARRIAHEIKNPLTPIQLSAERLRRRFGRVIADDREIFDQCTDTIIRQVGDIGRMVDEFSAFARMPKPAFGEQDLRQPIRDAVFLMQVANPDIAFAAHLPKEPLTGRFDARLIGQAFTNIVKNATEAIAALPEDRRGKGAITIEAGYEDGAIVVDVVDNGIGLPAENRQRLLEPYMTTREKGTGLGLAIVRKIVEEHGGRIELLDAPPHDGGGRGALVRVTLPRVPNESAEAETPAQQPA
jgi:two-component system nitrogen regulation sensor histidine kinase NtrY